jgi:hypothetical protein
MRTRMFHGWILGVSALLPLAGALAAGCQHCSSCGGGAPHGPPPVASGNSAYGGAGGMAAAPAAAPGVTQGAGAGRTEVQPAGAAVVPGSAGDPYGRQ